MSGFKIQRVWAFIAVDPGDKSGDEGIPAYSIGNLMIPLIAGHAKRVEVLKELAQKIADEGGFEIRLVEFSNKTELEVIKPVCHAATSGNPT